MSQTTTDPAPVNKFEGLGYKESGHTHATWAALHRSDAAELAFGIACQAEDLEAKLRGWLGQFGESADAGVDAIRAAGLEVPPEVQRHGTMLRELPEHFRGAQWMLEVFGILTRDFIPDLDEPANTLGAGRPDAGVTAPVEKPAA